MKKFRTIEISNPAFESDHLRNITVKSKYLKGRGDICVFVPPGIELMMDVPLIILLHGVYGSSWSWSRSGGVHLTALNMIREKTIPPMVIAMPSDGLWGDGSAYLPHNGYDFQKWIAMDVPEAVNQSVPQVTTFSPHFIGGLSMGGFGAFQTGINYPTKFKAISAHSSITHIEQMNIFVEENTQNYTQQNQANEDVLEKILKNRENLPALRFDCGEDDLLIAQNRLLHQSLLLNNVPHIYEEYNGGHSWEYWKEHIKESLLFFSSKL